MAAAVAAETGADPNWLLQRATEIVEPASKERNDPSEWAAPSMCQAAPARRCHLPLATDHERVDY